jgi:hypothetical protein
MWALARKLEQPEQHRNRLGLAHQVRPIELVEIGDTLARFVLEVVGRHHREIEIDAARLRMRPEFFIADGMIVVLEPNGIDDAAYGFKRALAAHAVHDKHGCP